VSAARRAFLAFACAAALAAATAGRADTPPTVPESGQKPTQAYGADHASCRQWTDGCLVCARHEDGSAACSMVGTACLPAAVVCLEGR
jgi:hypothetical protein